MENKRVLESGKIQREILIYMKFYIPDIEEREDEAEAIFEEAIS